MPTIVWLSVLALFGCSAEGRQAASMSDPAYAAGSKATEGEGGQGIATQCQELSFDECEVDSSCRLIVARQLVAEQGCYKSYAPINCRSREGCHDSGIVSFAQGADGSNWLLPTSCLPMGWRHVEPTPEQRLAAEALPCSPGFGPGAAPAQAHCDALAIDKCEADSECTLVVGGRLVPERSCYSPFEPISCRQREGCPDSGVIRFAEAGDGGVWIMPTGCLPLGWKHIEPSPEKSVPVCDTP